MQSPQSPHNHLNNNNTGTTTNPYQSPAAQLDTMQLTAVSPNTQTWYHLSGRIGRLRYLAYGLMMTFVGYFCVSIIVGILAAVLVSSVESDAFTGIMMLVYILFLPFLFYTAIIYPKRRLHDLGKSGWLALLLFVPIVNIFFGFYLMFAKGDVGVNEYGNPPRENKPLHYIGAIVVPLLGVAILGILAAIALPAYQDYAQRSQEAMLEVE